jgi:protein-S-isoprenylcysteine O-methyltransferase Ste14
VTSSAPSALAVEATNRRHIRREWRQLIGDLLLALFWASFAWRFLTAFLAHYRPQDGLLLLLESFTAAAFLTRRRPKTSSSDPGDWVIALAATMAPLFFGPERSALPLTLRVVLETVQAFGTCVSIFGVCSLRRSFGLVPANRGVRVSGLYRLVRHPIYAGYIVSYLAFILASSSVRNVAITIVDIVFQIIRINNEEHHLNLDPEYRKYAARTRWRLFPLIY